MRFYITFSFLTILLQVGVAQVTKRPISHTDYDSWKSIQRSSLSSNGEWVAYEVNPQEGDGVLYVEAPRRGMKLTVPRGYGAQFSADASYLVAKIKPEHEKVRMAKKAKAKADKMPKDSLVIISLPSGQQRHVPDLISFDLPDDKGNWMALLTKKQEVKKDSTQKSAKGKKMKTPKGDVLSLLNLDGTDSIAFENVSAYAIADQGNRAIYVQETLRDSLLMRGVYVFTTNSKASEILDTSSVVALYKNVVLDKKGNRAAWMASSDSAKAEVKAFALYMRDLSRKGNILVADSTSRSLPRYWSPSEYRVPRFSDEGTHLYFGVAPVALPSQKDTTLLDEELSSLDVWTWTDTRLQPMQAKQRKQDLERSYWAVYDPASRKVAQLATEIIPEVDLNFKTTLPFLLGRSNEPYMRQTSWDPGHSDYYLVNSETGARTLIVADVSGQANLSPAGNFAYWFDERDTVWKAYSRKTMAITELTRNIPVAFQDEEHDTPSLPGAYGVAGWTDNDKYLLVYDRYDIWKIDPTQKEKPVNLTDGYGRRERVQLRYLKVRKDEEFVDLSKPNHVWGQWESDKQTGILEWKAGSAPKILLKDPYLYNPGSVEKAKEANVFVFQKGNYTHPNELYYVADWKSPRQLTQLSGQLDSLLWGNVELVSWLSNQGTKLEGLLFKPENFDPSRKYPMLVYYYERNASTLHAFRAPAPSRSTINIPYCVSNGYLVFVPDIVYSGGTPGKNAYDCIVSGVLDLIKAGYVDEKNIGIQGQSWGGYQTAYLITQTNMFKAAMAGAIVANMTSAYGGIRWGTGMSRMFQYEKTQSRIGGTLWEKPMYYIENSPLFYADRVETPLLMMHNDADGAVPWYQGIEFFTALRRLNKPVWMLVYNDEDHNLTRRPNMKDLSIRMYQFFDHYLKAAPMPPWMSSGRSVLEKERWNMKYE